MNRLFQLTRSRGAWRKNSDDDKDDFQFQLTRSRGAWPCDYSIPCYLVNFNSHAHVERDVGRKIRRWNPVEFQLTRSRGAWLSPPIILHEHHGYFNSHAHVERDSYTVTECPEFEISTHTLTWSVTSPWPSTANECQKFQLTRSRGAWPAKPSKRWYYSRISTHTLTWSVTDLAAALWTCTEFQLTRSRGAWLLSSCIARCHSAFQLTRSRGAWHSLL